MRTDKSLPRISRKDSTECHEASVLPSVPSVILSVPTVIPRSERRGIWFVGDWNRLARGSRRLRTAQILVASLLGMTKRGSAPRDDKGEALLGMTKGEALLGMTIEAPSE